MTLALIGARGVPAVLHVLAFNLREDFAVPHVAIRIWGDLDTRTPTIGLRRVQSRARLPRD